MPVAVFIVARPAWGWSVRVPYTSVGGASYPLPPPTTVVGALAEPLAELLGWPEVDVAQGEVRGRRRTRRVTSVRSAAARLAEHILAVGAGLASGAVIVTYDLVRTENVPYLKTAHQRDPSQWFSVNAFGLAYSPGSRLCLALVFKDTITSIAGEDTLLKAAWSVTRIGSKEGLVSVEYASVSKRIEAVSGTPSMLYGPCSMAEESAPSVRAARPTSINAWAAGVVDEMDVCLALEEQIPGVYTPRAIVFREGYKIILKEQPPVPDECLIVPGGW